MSDAIINSDKGFWVRIVSRTIGAVGSFIALIIALSREKIDMRKIRVIESFVLIALIIFLARGTQETVMKLADRITTEQEISARARDAAVLQAYQQLSGELGRWFVMFVVLGAFFGLVLPLGSYLLQIRAINGREDEVDAKIKEREDRYEKASEKFRKELEEKSCREMERIQADCAKGIRRLWQGQVFAARGQFLLAISNAEDAGWKSSLSYELVSSLVLMLKFLEVSEISELIVKEVRFLAGKVKYVQSKTLDADAVTWKRGWKESSSKEEIALSSYCTECREEFQTLKAFLEGFGIHVLA